MACRWRKTLTVFGQPTRAALTQWLESFKARQERHSERPEPTISGRALMVVAQTKEKAAAGPLPQSAMHVALWMPIADSRRNNTLRKTSGRRPDGRTAAPFWFEIENSLAGRVGIFHARGKFDQKSVPIIKQFERLLPILDGLFLYLDSTGGRESTQMWLEWMLTRARLRMPVVAFGVRVLSAAVPPLLACHASYARPDAEIGIFGSMMGVCVDGPRP